MIIICYGMPKSASTFAFQLARDIANTHTSINTVRQKLPEDLDKLFFQELYPVLPRLQRSIKSEELYVIKTHCFPDAQTLSMIRQGLAKVIISIRDPYDIIVSHKEAGDIERKKALADQRSFAKLHTYEDIFSIIPKKLLIASSWIEQLDKKLVIKFSDIKNTPQTVAMNIAKFIGVDKKYVNEVLDKYLVEGKRIVEFNKGIEGRGRKEINVPIPSELKGFMDEFCSLFLTKESD